jgi:hypothetical protein
VITRTATRTSSDNHTRRRRRRGRVPKNFLTSYLEVPLAIGQVGAYLIDHRNSYTLFSRFLKRILRQHLVRNHQQWSGNTARKQWSRRRSLSRQSTRKTRTLRSCFYFVLFSVMRILMLTPYPMVYPRVSTKFAAFLTTCPPADCLEESQIDDHVGTLFSFSLASSKQDSDSLSIHPLVHTWARGETHTTTG